MNTPFWDSYQHKRLLRNQCDRGKRREYLTSGLKKASGPSGATSYGCFIFLDSCRNVVAASSWRSLRGKGWCPVDSHMSERISCIPCWVFGIDCSFCQQLVCTLRRDFNQRHRLSWAKISEPHKLWDKCCGLSCYAMGSIVTQQQITNTICNSEYYCVLQ